MKYHFSRKLRQLKFRLKQLKRNELGYESVSKLKSQIKQLYYQIPLKRQSRKCVLSTSILMLGITLNTNAQTFLEGVYNPFGLEKHLWTYDEKIFDFDFADLNGDSKNELVLYKVLNDGSYNYYNFYYSENNGTDLDSIEHLIYELPKTYIQVAFQVNNFAMVDLDGDGDQDILAIGSDYYFSYGGSCGSNFFFIENEGTSSEPEFNQHQIDPFGLDWPCKQGLVNIDLADVDSDGDIDIFLSGSFRDAENDSYYEPGFTGLAFFENIGTNVNPLFDDYVINPFGIEFNNDTDSINVSSIYWDDFNYDGKLDMFGHSFMIKEDTILSKEILFLNQGTTSEPYFSNFQLDPFLEVEADFNIYNFFLTKVFDKLADVDNDGDMDYIIFEERGLTDDISFGYNFYERLSNITSSYELTQNQVNVWPNPTSEKLYIELEGLVNYRIVNANGQQISVGLLQSNGSEASIDIKGLQNGMYLLELFSKEGSNSKVFIKQ